MANASTNQKALKAGIGYTIGNIFSKGITFLSVPIFSRLMSVSDYGVYSTFVSYMSVLCLILGVALHTSVKNAVYDYPKKLNEYCSSVSLIPLMNALILLGVGLIFSEPLGKLMGLDSGMILLLVVESTATTLLTFYNHLLAVDYRYKEYLGLSLTYAIGGVVLSILLILFAYTEKTYWGRAIGATAIAVLIAIYILFRMYRAAKPKVNLQYWKYGLKLSLPIVPHGFSQLILAQFDRIMIHRVVGSVEAGLYSFAYNIGTIYQVITNSLDTVWTTWFFEQMSGRRYALIRKVANYYITLLTMGAMALILISPEILTIMGGAEYAESRFVAPPIVLAMFYSAIYNFHVSVEYFYKKTNLIAIGTLIAAILNMILNAIFIPYFGYIAAAYTTVVCYILYYFMHMYFAHKIHGATIFSTKWHLFCQLFTVITCFLCVLIVDQVILRMIILIGLVVVGAVLLYRNLPEMKMLLKDTNS